MVESELKEITRLARKRPATGMMVLFSGPDEPAKVKAAEAVADELRRELLRVDLSAAVSKYVGETEKNLEKLFGPADPARTILFFDQADVLFGKRSEAKDAHERYANIEVGHLLERIESYSGLAILATNLRRNIDSAFLRRLRFVVEFPLPSAEGRRDIWGKRSS